MEHDDQGSDMKNEFLICFSQLRWNFVFQRPQHLMTRFAESLSIIYWEEPTFENIVSPNLCKIDVSNRLKVITPKFPNSFNKNELNNCLRNLLNEFIRENGNPAIKYYFTPMAIAYSQDTMAKCVVYDCMDELSAFKFAPAEMQDMETVLLNHADVVFTGGRSIFDAKKDRHSDVHFFPSAVDVQHFSIARSRALGNCETPRLGFYGVIDERMDLGLLAALADARPGWLIDIVGPIAKIRVEDLPMRPNLNYLGKWEYDRLPELVSSWHVSLMPFAINDATKFISPTKTPEYLAAGRPVVSTAITDVIREYSDLEGVFIAYDSEEYILCCDSALNLVSSSDTLWLQEVDIKLANMSWDITAQKMLKLMMQHVSSRKNKHFDCVVVGAGFAGAVMAERFANDSGKRVLVIDRRDHIGGNAYDYINDDGILVHKYGPHIFHTNSDCVYSYLSNFTDWRNYEHKVLADIKGMLLPIPVNMNTLNKLYNIQLKSEKDVQLFLADKAENIPNVETSEQLILSTVGSEIYSLFFKGYTEKQWGIPASQLDKSVISRVATRFNDDDRYFTDKYQSIPERGYTSMFSNMLSSPNITLQLETSFDDIKENITWDTLVYTGPIDEYYSYKYGKLPYRSLRFEHVTFEVNYYQESAVINYPGLDVDYTRITEFKHITGQEAFCTSVVCEYPSAVGDPYYPIPNKDNVSRYKLYEDLSLSDPSCIFVGRLANYRYYNMDQVVAQALSVYAKWKKRCSFQDNPPIAELS